MGHHRKRKLFGDFNEMGEPLTDIVSLNNWLQENLEISGLFKLEWLPRERRLRA